MEKTVKLFIDGQEVEIDAGATLIQAAEQAGVEIPRFCYHERLAIAGNCRMCLVEVENMPKPIASCAMPVADGLKVHTLTKKVKAAREGVMEFLLMHHPLDCPICDQGGECDLQDQAMAYGRGHSEYTFSKRAVSPKYMGPLIKTHMTRCIHCTRCVRFATDVAGVPELGTLNRGENMEIISYLHQALTSELSGNIIDLCPVGALTSAPYAYKARPWELTKTESIDVLDAVGSNIRIDTKDQHIVRILPRLHEDINEEWLSDKSRFACDGLQQQRLDKPYLRKRGRLEPVSWQEAIEYIASKAKSTDPKKIAALAGDLIDVEAMMVLKDIMDTLKAPHMDCRQDNAYLNTQNRSHYLFNTTISGIEEADLCLIVGAHPRYEAPLINARLRKRSLQGNFPIGYIGADSNSLTYSCSHLGESPTILKDIYAGTHDFAKLLKMAKKPIIIVGQDALRRSDSKAIYTYCVGIAEKYMNKEGWNGFNILHTAAARVGGLDIGFIPQRGGQDTAGIIKLAADGNIDVAFLLGVDEIAMAPFKKACVIYIGHHGDRGAQHADVILPGATYAEKSATYVNTEGRVQQTQSAIFSPGDALAEWEGLLKVAAALDISLPYKTLTEIRQEMAIRNPVFAHLDCLTVTPWTKVAVSGRIEKKPLPKWQKNFYMTDPISRHSVTMARCSQEILQQASKPEALYA